jgi:hypothetical protein
MGMSVASKGRAALRPALHGTFTTGKEIDMFHAIDAVSFLGGVSITLTGIGAVDLYQRLKGCRRYVGKRRAA